MNTGSGAESNTINFLFNDGYENLLLFEKNISHGLHSYIPDDNELLFRDVSIKSSNVWFLFKLKLMGLFILSLTLDLSLILDYFII